MNEMEQIALSTIAFKEMADRLVQSQFSEEQIEVALNWAIQVIEVDRVDVGAVFNLLSWAGNSPGVLKLLRSKREDYKGLVESIINRMTVDDERERQITSSAQMAYDYCLKNKVPVIKDIRRVRGMDLLDLDALTKKESVG